MPTVGELEIKPPPRTVRSRARVWLVRWLFVCFALILPWLMVSLGIALQKDRVTLRDRGVQAVGKVISKHPQSKSLPRVKYQYQIAAQTFVLWDSALPAVFERLQIGDEVSVLVLPDQPAVAELADSVRAGGYSSGALTLWLLSTILFVIMVPCWTWVEILQRRLRHLARNGVAARTTSVSVTRGAYYQGVQIYWASYDFHAKSKKHHGRTSVVQSVANDLSQPSTQAIVLYNPDDPNRFELLLAITTHYQIVPADSKSTFIRIVFECVVLLLILGLGVAIQQGTLEVGRNAAVE